MYLWSLCPRSLFLLLLGISTQGLAQQLILPNLHEMPTDLTVPEVSAGPPAAGKRVSLTSPAWQGTAVHHLLYLPTDWQKETKGWPVIVEYAGNGGYKNKYGDVSEGTVEGSRLGYGLSAGRGFLWLCLPYVEQAEDSHRNAIKWWGDMEETKRYCITTVKAVCAEYGGDPSRVILCGFSRGAIACNYLGLHDDEISQLWRGFLCHSHYDGVLITWPYAGADRASALARLQRLAGRPQWISHEGSVEATQLYLQSTGLQGDWTFAPLPFHNHTDAWILRDVPLRRQAREWLEKVVKK